MQKQVITPNQSIPYSVRVSRRARRIRISVGCETGVVVTLPFGLQETRAEDFVKRKFSWIVKSLKYLARYKHQPVIKSNRRDYLKYKQQALVLAKHKLSQWNSHYGFSYHRVSIKNQKTRWGSCSKKGNLNFNYKIVRLPENLLDYLIVHELCHLEEMNHRKSFWDLVGQTIPDYKNSRRQLRNFGMNYARV